MPFTVTPKQAVVTPVADAASSASTQLKQKREPGRQKHRVNFKM